MVDRSYESMVVPSVNCNNRHLRSSPSSSVTNSVDYSPESKQYSSPEPPSDEQPKKRGKRPRVKDTYKRDSERKCQRLTALRCQMVDKTAGIFVVRSSAVGVGFPVHVIFKKTHPKEFHCEIRCEMQDRQLCKHLSAVERYVRENNLYSEEDNEVSGAIDANEDFPDLDQIELFHRITDDEKCEVYNLHNYCLENNTPVIKPFHSQEENASATFYSVCSATFTGFSARSGRVITTYDHKTHKYRCKCLHRDCVHMMVSKLYRAGQGFKDCYGENNMGSAGIPMTASHQNFNKRIKAGWKKRKNVNLYVKS